VADRASDEHGREIDALNRSTARASTRKGRDPPASAARKKQGRFYCRHEPHGGAGEGDGHAASRSDDLLEMPIFVALPDDVFGTGKGLGSQAGSSPGVRPFKQLRVAPTALEPDPIAWVRVFRFHIPNHDITTFRSTLFVFHGSI